MINLAVHYLEGDPYEDDDYVRVQEHVENDIKYVVVDEYQDVNPLQERLVRGLVQFGANLCVVGDDDQTIYQWRGSQVSNIVTFARPLPRRQAGHPRRQLPVQPRRRRGRPRPSPSASRAGSACQRRWSPPATSSGHAAICLPSSSTTLMRRRSGLSTASSQCAACRSSTSPAPKRRGLSWSDFAVLFRSVARDSGPLVDELRKRGIPFIVKGLNKLFDSPEIQAVVGIFQFMVDTIDAATLEAAVGRRTPHPRRRRLDQGA